MSERALIAKPGAEPLQVGRRDDPAERRVEARLSEDPALHALHGGALDTAPHPVEDGGGRTNGWLDGPGAPLASDLRTTMNRAFGEDFGHVRIHTDGAAAAQARELDAAAFATGKDVGFASGAFRPDTPAGRGIIAHELAHVSDIGAGRDGANMVRRVGFGEWVKRLFGAGTYTDAELARFLGSLAAADYEPDYTIETDDMARQVVETGLHATQSLRVRFRLIEHLLHGFASKEDEEAVLTILTEAPEMEREQLVSQYTKQKLYDKFGGENLERLTGLIDGKLVGGVLKGGTEQSRKGTVPVHWKLNYSITNASELRQGIAGLGIENFQVRPDSKQDWQMLRDKATLKEGLAARDLQLTTNPLPHPKNEAGRGAMNIWVVPSDPALWPLYAASTYRALPAGSANVSSTEIPASVGLPYGSVAATEKQAVEANVDVKLAPKKVGTLKQSLSTTIATETTESEQTRAGTKATVGSTTGTGSETGMSVTDRYLQSLGLDVQQSRANMLRWEEMRNWQTSVTRALETLLRLEGSVGSETTTEEGGEAEVSIGASIGAEAAASLAAKLGVDLGVTFGLDGLGAGLLESLLSALGPEGVALAAVLELVKEATGSLTGEIGADGKVSVRGDLSGNARAKKLWNVAKKNSFQLGGEVSQKGTVSGTGQSGGASTIGGEGKIEDTAGAHQKVEGGREVTGSRKATSMSQVNKQLETMNERLTTIEAKIGSSTTAAGEATTDTFLPEVVDARLSFRVVRDAWGSLTPQGEQKPEPAEEESQKKRRRGRGG